LEKVFCQFIERFKGQPVFIGFAKNLKQRFEQHQKECMFEESGSNLI
jgi:predicted GIY-YIG superfamily endonuclease